MKNLKKVLALVLAFSMLLSVAAFASFPDVEEDATYASAVNVLSDLGIVVGDENGNFNPDSTVTRAEVAAFVLRTMGYEDSAEAAKGTTNFTDVPADHWASGYINLANQLKVIIGNGDGTFNPEGPVTYQEAVKMVVCALGYEYSANQKGGWPTGYLVVANSNKLNKNVPTIAGTDEAPRSVVASLLYNALDVYLMEESYNNGVTYVVCNGKNGTEEKTLLTTNLGLSKLAGMVMANSKTDMTGANTPTKDGVVKYEYTDTFKTTDEVLIKGVNKVNNLTFNVGDTDAADTIGVNTIAYVENVKNKEYNIVSIMLDDAASTKVVVDAADIDDGERTSDNKVAYFATKDATRSTQLTLNEDSLRVITNNVTERDVSVSKFITDYKKLLDTASVLEFVDNDGDDIYDVVTVKTYMHKLVDEVDVARNSIDFTDSTKLKIDEEKEDVSVSIKNQAGEALTLEDINQYDVFAIISDSRSFTTAKVIDITVLDAENAVVEGRVTGKDPSNNTYTIGSTEYDLSAGFTNIDLGDEGTFYLDITGKIFDKVVRANAVDGNYGLLIQTDEYTGEFGAKTYLAEILTSEGKVETYNLAKKVKTLGNKSYNVKSTETNTEIPAGTFKNTPWESLTNGKTTTWGDIFTDAMFKAKSVVADKTAQDARLVKYAVNADGEITSILPATSGRDSNLFNYSGNTSDYGYYGNDLRLGRYFMSESAVVFSIPEDGDLTDATAKSISSLVDGSTYSATLFGYDANGNYGAVLIKGSKDKFSKDTNIGIVKSTGERYDVDSGTQLVTVTFVSENDDAEKVMVIDEDASCESVATTLDTGDVFVYAAGADDVITSYAVIAKLGKDSKGNTIFVLDANADTLLEDNEFHFGYVDEFKNSTITLKGGNIADPNGSTFSTTGVNQYLYDNFTRPSRPSIVVGDYRAVNFYNKVYPDKEAGTEESTLVFVRTVDEATTDVYAIASTYDIK